MVPLFVISRTAYVQQDVCLIDGVPVFVHMYALRGVEDFTLAILYLVFAQGMYFRCCSYLKSSDTGDCAICEYGYWGLKCEFPCSSGCAENPSLRDLYNSSSYLYPTITPAVLGDTPLCDRGTGIELN
jgi:hypothetical protein